MHNLNPFAFERLSQLLLRESGLNDVVVTKRTRDGGIDGYATLKLHEFITMKVAFQCKRYKDNVTADDIGSFRGRISQEVEKAILFTTSNFTKPAIDEAKATGKLKVELVNGDEFIDKLAEYKIGLNPVTTYEIDENYFSSI